MAHEIERWGIDAAWNTDDESDLFERQADGRWVRFEDHVRLVRELEAELLRLRAVVKQTHANYCTEAWTDRGLHAPECLAYEMDADD